MFFTVTFFFILCVLSYITGVTDVPGRSNNNVNDTDLGEPMEIKGDYIAF